MKHLTRLAVGAALLATAAACDSMPGALDPPAPGPATLSVRNTGSRTITAIDVVRCSSNPEGDVRWVPVSIGPNQTWSRNYAIGCHTVEVQFNSGGDWVATVMLSATAVTQINPF